MKINKTHIEKIISLSKEYGATKLILFGSASKMSGEARDLDLACDGISGWKLYELAARLEEELKTSLDIVPLSPSNRFTQYVVSKGKILL